MKPNLRGAWWHVDKFVEEHNHPVIKKFDLVKFLRAHRHITPEEEQFVKLLHDCNLRTCRMMQILAQLHDKLIHKKMVNLLSVVGCNCQG